MNNVVIKKKSVGLCKVSCDCGYVKFFDLGVDADVAGEKHAQECAPAVITRLFNGVEDKNTRTARPGRPAGGANYGLGDSRP